MDRLLTPELWIDSLRGRSRFAFSAPRRLALGGLAIVAAAACAIIVIRAALPALESVWLTGILGFVALCGGAAAVWRDRIDLRFDIGMVLRRRGLYPFLRREEWPLTEAIAVSLENVERKDASGMPAVRSNLVLDLRGGGRVVLLRDCTDDRIEALAAAIADRLGWPARIVTVPLAVGRPPRLVPRIITGALWTAMLAVTVFTAGSLVRTARSRPRENSFQQQQLPSPAIEPYRAGLELYYGKRFQAAEESFNNALRQSPTSAEIWNMLSYSQAEQGSMDKALESAQRAVRLAPEEGYILDTLAEMHERRKEYEAAAKLYSEALKRMNPAVACETHTKFARTLIASNHSRDAIEHLMEALRYPDPQWEPLAKRLLRRIAPNIAVPAPIRQFGGRSLR